MTETPFYFHPLEGDLPEEHQYFSLGKRQKAGGPDQTAGWYLQEDGTFSPFPGGRQLPVKVKKRGDKYRVVEADTGRLARKGDTPVDGGGHTDRSKAAAQVRAINASIDR